MKQLISIVIPIYNEEENIYELNKRLIKVLENDFGDFGYEIIFVDDGSKDKSLELLKNLKKQNNNIKIISFSRNFGHHIALTAGLDNCKGELIVIMDADLQDQPEEIIKLYQSMIKNNFDIVYGIRKNRKDNIFKKLGSKIFWSIINNLSGLTIPRNQSALKLFNKKVLISISEFKEYNRFYQGILSWVGFNQGECLVNHSKRYMGETKYTISKLVNLSINAVLGFSNKPLYTISYTGLILSLVSFMYMIYIIMRKLTMGIGIEGWTSIMAFLTFMIGIIIFFMGIIGLYLGKLYQQSLNRPIYIINEKLID